MLLAMVPAWLTERFWEQGLGQWLALGMGLALAGIGILRPAAVSRGVLAHASCLGLIALSFTLGGLQHGTIGITLAAVGWMALHLGMVLAIRDAATVAWQAGIAAALILVVAAALELTLNAGAAGRRTFGFGTGNINSLLLCMGCLAMVAAILGPPIRQSRAWVGYATLALGLASLAWLGVDSGRRGLWLSMLAGGWVALLPLWSSVQAPRRRWLIALWLLGASAIIAGTIWAITIDRPRALMISAAYAQASDHLLIGRGAMPGLAALDAEAHGARMLTATGLFDHHPHHEPIALLLSGGSIAVLAAFVCCCLLVRRFLRGMAADRRSTAAGFAIGFIGITAGFDPSFSTPAGWATIAIPAALIFSFGSGDPIASARVIMAMHAAILAALLHAQWQVAGACFLARDAWASVRLAAISRVGDPNVLLALVLSLTRPPSSAALDRHAARLALDAVAQRLGTLPGLLLVDAATYEPGYRQTLGRRFPFHPEWGRSHSGSAAIDRAAARLHSSMGLIMRGRGHEESVDALASLLPYADIEQVALVLLWHRVHHPDGERLDLQPWARHLRFALRSRHQLIPVLGHAAAAPQPHRLEPLVGFALISPAEAAALAQRGPEPGASH